MFGGRGSNHQFVTTVERYSLTTKTWQSVAEVTDYRRKFCLCAFAGAIYFIGGQRTSITGKILSSSLRSCLKFDPVDNTWKEVAGTTEARSSAACATYEGRIVVSGGCDGDNARLNTVEAYDHVTDAWSSMPSMIERRFQHGSVAVRNKLFVLGNYLTLERESCEVFDSNFGKFVFLKQKPASVTFKLNCLHFSFFNGSKIVILGNGPLKALCYDVETEKWTEEMFDTTKDIKTFGCSLIPKLKF